MLNANEKQNVAYCIPIWLRDEQIKLAIKRVKDRLLPHYDSRPEPIAIVCYGPSLADTWEHIKGFEYVITCSGAHKFLVDRGIIPTWHVEVDPRPHKVHLIGTPTTNTDYLIASTCHPDVFDLLEKHHASVKLWHVFDNTEDGSRALPPGEWAITGGCGVGLRAMTIAAFMGFRDLHIFGMDGNYRPDAGSHADKHPNQPRRYETCMYDGVEYQTTPGFLEAARQTWHELDQMPSVKATFYGEGLVQHMWRNYVPNTSGRVTDNIIGFAKPELISEEYRELNSRLHTDNLAYGVGGGKHANTVLALAKSLQTTSVLDYGCGKGYLGKHLPFPIWEYDPAIPEKADAPRPADLVVCTDVLEHIEPDKLRFVLDDLHRCTKKIGFFSIHTGAAGKTYANGQNTHLIQKPRRWWEKQLSKFFKIGKVFEVGPVIVVVVEPLPHSKLKRKLVMATQ